MPFTGPDPQSRAGVSPEGQGAWDRKTRPGRNPAKGSGEAQPPTLGGEGPHHLTTGPEPPRTDQEVTLSPGSDSCPHLHDRLACKTFSVLDPKKVIASCETHPGYCRREKPIVPGGKRQNCAGSSLFPERGADEHRAVRRDLK